MKTIYGLKNCDSCRKTMRWLASRDIEAEMIDVREHAVPAHILESAINQFGIDTLVNRRSTTWRQLDETERTLQSTQDALSLIEQHPTLMKRPLLVVDGAPLAIGFSDKNETWLGLS